MPLSKKEKSEYNKKRYQESKLGILKKNQIPNSPVRPDDKQERLAALRKLMANPVKQASSIVTQPVIESKRIEVYRSGRRYKPGTELLNPATGEIIIAPELDADGNPIW